MKIQTNAGEVELTAEMVCRGMVFRHDVLGRMVFGVDNNDAQNISTRVRHGYLKFIGLDSRHACPEDVERLCCGAKPSYEDLAPSDGCTFAIGPHAEHEDLATGVKWGASGTAIAKAFTYPPYTPDASIKVDGTEKSMAGDRQRAGSSVDTAKANVRTRLDSAKGHFFTGSPDSIRRVLAACDLRAAVHRLAPGSYRVTLEGADAVLCDAVRRWLSDNGLMYVAYEVASTSAKPTCGNCAQTITDPFPLHFASDRSDGTLESGLICTRCAREIEPSAMTVRNGRIMPKFVPSSMDSMPEVRATGTSIAGPQAPTAALQNSVERMARHDESGVLGFCAFIAGLKRWAVFPEGKRAAQEQALVALVNACPEGLNPVGWRAAVLALHEPRSGVEGVAFFHRDEIGERISIERQLRDDEVFTLAGEIAVPAYRRAIAPRVKVAPERKQRGPAIVVDDGRDE